MEAKVKGARKAHRVRLTQNGLNELYFNLRILLSDIDPNYLEF